MSDGCADRGFVSDEVALSLWRGRHRRGWSTLARIVATEREAADRRVLEESEITHAAAVEPVPVLVKVRGAGAARLRARAREVGLRPGALGARILRAALDVPELGTEDGAVDPA
jgi:hypothetical protein